MSGFKNEILRANGIVLSAADAADQRITNLLQNLEAGSTMITNFNGNPEGSLQGNVGSLCLDRANGILYIKVTGTGNTGWEVVTSNLTITGDTGGALSPTAGNWNILGEVVANGTNAKPVSVDGAVSTETINVQLATALTADAGDTNDVGLSSYYDQSFAVNSNGLVYSKANQTVPGVVNLGISYSAGTFTVHGQDGTALSATNPAYVTLQSTTPGQLVTIPVTANQSFEDAAGTSNIIGNLFGLTSGVAVTNNIPFWLYACLNSAEDTITFGISRVPHLNISPLAANIGTPASAIADVQFGLFLFNSVTVADYASNPVLNIGGFTMRMSASDDWTVQTLTSSHGIGKLLDGEFYSIPRGQYGAASGKLFANNGGTAPDDASQNIVYTVSRGGICTGFVSFPSIDVAGVGAVTAQMVLPYVSGGGGDGFFGEFNAGANQALVIGAVTPSSSFVTALKFTSSVANGTLQNVNFGLGIILAGQFNFTIQKA